MSWNERYDTQEYVYGKSPNTFLHGSIKHLTPGGKILCVAEGEGRNAVYLATLGYQVTAVDSSSVGLAKAQKLARENNVSLTTVVADLGDFPVETEAWDGVVSIFAHLPEALRAELHNRIAKGLKPGGMLILEAYTPQQIELGTGGPPNAAMTMSLEKLESELPGLEFIHAVELEREVLEGSLHTGLGAVVQLIAKKPE